MAAWQILAACACAAPGVCLGLLLVVRRRTLVGVLLMGVGALPLVLLAPQSTPGWMSSLPGPGAQTFEVVGAGIWIWFYLPPALLALFFPDGHLPGRRWRWLVVGWGVLVVAFQTAVGFDPGTYGDGPGKVPGKPPVAVPAGVVTAVGFALLALMLGLLVASVVAAVSRYRHGSPVVRRQLRWFALSVALLPLVLGACWLSILVAGGPGTAEVVGLLSIFVTLPVAVAIGVLRHDLYDIDRLLSRTVSYTILTALLTAVFGVAVVTTGLAVGRGSTVAVAVATLACALCFGPFRRRVQRFVDARFDRDRRDALAQLARFVDAVRDGRAEPESIEAVLRAALRDPELTVVYALTDDRSDDGSDEGPEHHAAAVTWRDSSGTPAGRPRPPFLDIAAGGRLLGSVGYGAAAVRPGLFREVLREAQLPLEVARSRIELKLALAATAASRARLVEAGDAERRRLERDLHDGAQQRLVSIGLSLRLAQQRALTGAEPGGELGAVLDRAVDDLRDAVAELRQLAAGVRPRGLDEGLSAALRTLARAAPIPIGVEVTASEVPDPVATTAYYVAAEAVANALKHGAPRTVRIEAHQQAETLHVLVSDDGCGGAAVVPGSGLAGLSDRVLATGGTLTVRSEPGRGTRIEALLPCGS